MAAAVTLTPQYFQFAETAQSAEAKSFVNLTPLTPGSAYQLANHALEADLRPRILPSAHDPEQGLLL